MSTQEQRRVWDAKYRAKPGYLEAQRLRQRKWREVNREKRYEYHKQYVGRNREKVYQRNKNRLARKKGAVGQISAKDWNGLKRKYDNRCFYCHRLAPLTQDHVIPLSRGGSNFIGNILPSCGSCNSRKNTKFIMEWKLELRAKSYGR